MTWARTYGGPLPEQALSIDGTADGGYVVAGSYGGWINEEQCDLMVLKLDALGNIEWQKLYGGEGDDLPNSIRSTSDGGCVVGGGTGSYGHPSGDAWILKLDSNGEVEWQKFGGWDFPESARSVEQTSDGGYIVGIIEDFDPSIWIAKLDPGGSVVWQRKYSGNDHEYTSSVEETQDGGFIVAGYLEYDWEMYGDTIIIRLEADGEIRWRRVYGGDLSDVPAAARSTMDGGFVVAGWSQSFEGIDIGYWVLRLDGEGEIVWQRSYPGGDWDEPEDVRQTRDGGFVVTGDYTIYVSEEERWESGVCLLRLDAEGDVLWRRLYGGESYEEADSVVEAGDGGFAVAGFTSSYGAGESDFWVLKTDGGGDIRGCPPGMIRDLETVSRPTGVSPLEAHIRSMPAGAELFDSDATAEDAFAGSDAQCGD